MSSFVTRRSFLVGAGALAVATSFRPRALAGLSTAPLYPPMDLSYFEKPVTPAPFKLEFGCAAITWGGDDLQAIKDISEIGFPGIQLRANILKDFGARPPALRDLLQQNRLEMVAFSSGGVHIAAASEAEEITLHTQHAAFVRDVGGHYMQVTDAALPKGRRPLADDFKRLGRLLSEIGKRSLDIGVPVGYHNHMGTLGEAPDDVDRIMDAADARYVKFELDIAHYFQGGGDPARAVRRYSDRLLFLHFKDVVSLPTSIGTDAKQSYRFVELGRGLVNLPDVCGALKDVNFRGWAVVELDGVTDKARTPKESALISKKYIEEKLGMKV